MDMDNGSVMMHCTISSSVPSATLKILKCCRSWF